jgi:hypothetical protein
MKNRKELLEAAKNMLKETENRTVSIYEEVGDKVIRVNVTIKDRSYYDELANRFIDSK